ncbi:MAG: hypothetical protein M1552_03110 [Firmicutes bacterium]|nr:hypothetical protein [Bacillota bacterium]
MKETQELLRHENITTTADIYSHVSIEMKQPAVNKFDQNLTNGHQSGTKTNFRCCILTIELEAELKPANRRVVNLEEMVTILKKATAIFAPPPEGI